MPEEEASIVDLAAIRHNIDGIDAQIIHLISERQRWVEAAGRAKAGQPTDAVRAPARVEAVIAGVRERALVAGASPEVVEATYRTMIVAFIEHELRVHAGGA